MLMINNIIFCKYGHFIYIPSLFYAAYTKRILTPLFLRNLLLEINLCTGLCNMILAKNCVQLVLVVLAIAPDALGKANDVNNDAGVRGYSDGRVQYATLGFDG